jgi:hypothetical protein
MSCQLQAIGQVKLRQVSRSRGTASVASASLVYSPKTDFPTNHLRRTESRAIPLLIACSSRGFARACQEGGWDDFRGNPEPGENFLFESAVTH